MQADGTQVLEVLAHWPKHHVWCPAAHEGPLGSVSGTLGGLRLPVHRGNTGNHFYDPSHNDLEEMTK